MSSQKGEDVAADNIYTAERLVKKRLRRGRAEYLVKWQGYSEKSNTWEPESNILDRNLIDDYERRNAPPTDADSAKAPSSAVQSPSADPSVSEAPKRRHSEAGRRKRHSEHYLPSVPAKKRLSAKSESSNVEIITDVQVNNVRVTFRESACLPSQSARPLASNSNGSDKRPKALEEAEHACPSTYGLAKLPPSALALTATSTSAGSQPVASPGRSNSQDRDAPSVPPANTKASTGSPQSRLLSPSRDSTALKPLDSTCSPTSVVAKNIQSKAETASDESKRTPAGGDASVTATPSSFDKSPSDANGRPGAPAKTSAERNGKATAGGKLEKIVEVCKAKATPATASSAGFTSQSSRAIELCELRPASVAHHQLFTCSFDLRQGADF